MNRRNRTKASSNAAAKAPQPSKQPTPAQQPTTSAPVKPAAPAHVRSARPPAAPSPPKPTPSAILRQAWNSFEPWLSARRAEKDKKVSEKMKELMSGKGKGRNGKQAASSTEDIGAFEDRLNEELAEQARAEWLKRVGATGFDESDWTDITEAEMAKVEEAFVPQPRANPAPEPRITPPPAVPETKPVVLPKVTAGRGRYAATVEDEDSPAFPGGWMSPGPAVPATGVIGKTRAETPAQQARGNPLAGGRATQKETLPTPESLWEMHMNKPSTPSALRTSTPAITQEKTQAESLWDRQFNASPDSVTPPSTTVPTPDSLWEPQMSKSIPQSHSKTPALPSENMWGVPAQKSMMYQMEAQAGSLWDLQTSKMVHPDLGMPTQMKGPGLTIPSSTSKTPAPMKGSTPLSDSLWDSVMAAKHAPSMEQSVSFAPTTPTMAPMSAAHSYISPVFVEMEDDSFPRLDDPLPDNVVEESIRRFHAAAADADIGLRRRMLSGKLDDEEMEQLVATHLSQIEHSARSIVEQWNKARKAELERLEQEAEKQRIVEEQKRMLAEAKKNGRKKWGLSPATPAPEPTPTPAQPKKKGRRGTIQQEALAEAQELARAATPVGKPAKQAIIQDDATPQDTFWKASNKAAGLASSLKGKLSTPSPPTPASAPIARAGSTKPSPSILNPFASNVPKKPTPELSPWEAMMAKKKDDPPEPSWDEPEDDSEGGSSFWESALGQAKGGATSAWGFFSGNQPEQYPPPSKAASPPVVAPIPSAPTKLDSFWPNEDNFAKGIPRGAMPAVPGFGTAHGFGGPPADPRFATWRPPRMLDPEEPTDPAKKMADLALENLLDITSTDEYSRPDDIFNAMSMYTKASTSASRKRGAR